MPRGSATSQMMAPCRQLVNAIYRRHGVLVLTQSPFALNPSPSAAPQLNPPDHSLAATTPEAAGMASHTVFALLLAALLVTAGGADASGASFVWVLHLLSVDITR